VIASLSTPWDSTARTRQRLVLAVGLSVAVHAAAWYWAHLPSVTIDLPEPTLEVAIVQKPVPESPRVVPSEEVVTPKPPSATPMPQVHKSPAPRVAAAPSPTPAPVPVESAPREAVITARPETSPAAEFTVPPPPVPPVAKLIDPQPPSPDALAGYGRSVSQALARHREYPRLALMRGWEGATTLRLRVAPGGRLAEAAVHQSSGHEVLDDQALAMVKRLGTLPLPPESLRDREFAVLVPVVFQLAK
jgi:periplasmic protein TonB